ncbi:MAG: hypothetical protein ABGX16_18255 [Pirellulales bacterium]
MAERTRTATRRSPDMGSRQGELESALSGLLEPQQDLPARKHVTDEESVDTLDVIPPRAAGAETLPGFLSYINQSYSAADSVSNQPKLPHSTSQKSHTKQTTRVDTIVTKSQVQRKSSSQSSSSHPAPLDLRRALQQESDQDTLAWRVANEMTTPNTAESQQVSQQLKPTPKSPLTSVAESKSKISGDLKPHIPAKGIESQANDKSDLPQPKAEPISPEMLAASQPTSNQVKPDLSVNQLRSTKPSPTSQETLSRLEKSQTLSDNDEVKLSQDNPEKKLLFSYQQPMIASHVEGPQRILVGREANYRIILKNQGDTAAESLIVTVHIPDWTEVVDTTSSIGIVQKAEAIGSMGSNKVAAETNEGNSLQWRIQQLEPNSSQALNLRLVPHQGRSMQLGVSWVHSPVGSDATIEVQEPKLQMAISGPDNVQFGKPQRYQLSLSNPGTGVAEDVRIQLIPPGGNAESATTHKIGALQPEETQTIDLELTAREAGELRVQAFAFAAGNLRTETTKHLFCRKPELELDCRGPDTKYAGTEATYYFRIRNSGTAPTDPMLLNLQLPKGVKFLAASEGQFFDAQKHRVTWKLTELNPQEEKYVQVNCRLEQAGLCSMQLTAHTATGELQDEKSIETNIVALADLKLEVSDPRGPIPVGQSATYEIRIANRGSSHAQGVNIVGLFSEGIDPISVEGAQYSIRDGRVSFQTIKSLPAGRDLVLRIHAKATRPGMHLFRAEVVCQDLDIKLSSEEMTRFFEDDFRWAKGNSPYTVERKVAERNVIEAPVIRR